MPGRIISRRSISSNSCAALSWASRSRSARAFSSAIGFCTATMLRPNGALMSLVVPPYPPARYTKDEPEVSAWIRRADEPPDYETYGVKYHYLANQQATGGDYGLYRVDIAPAGGGPGPHFHRAMSEAFCPDAVRFGRAEGGLLRGLQRAGRHDRRRTPRVVHSPRQFFRVDGGVSPTAQNRAAPACSSRREI